MNDDGVATAIRDKSRPLWLLLPVTAEAVNIKGITILRRLRPFAECFELLGNILGIGIGEGENAHDPLGGFLAVQRGDQLLNLPEVFFTGVNDERIGARI